MLTPLSVAIQSHKAAQASLPLLRGLRSLDGSNCAKKPWPSLKGEM